MHCRKPREARMIRVTKSEEGERIIITIDGQLSGDYIEVVEIFCDQALTERRPIDIFLARCFNHWRIRPRPSYAFSRQRHAPARQWHIPSYVVPDLVAGCSKALDSPGGRRKPDTGFQHTGPRDSGVFETLTKGLSPVNNG